MLQRVVRFVSPSCSDDGPRRRARYDYKITRRDAASRLQRCVTQRFVAPTRRQRDRDHDEPDESPTTGLHAQTGRKAQGIADRQPINQ